MNYKLPISATLGDSCLLQALGGLVHRLELLGAVLKRDTVIVSVRTRPDLDPIVCRGCRAPPLLLGPSRLGRRLRRRAQFRFGADTLSLTAHKSLAIRDVEDTLEDLVARILLLDELQLFEQIDQVEWARLVLRNQVGDL